MVPGWDVPLVQELRLSLNTARLPITQAGCAGGVLAIARAVDYVRAHPTQDALVVAAEVCSLAFHPYTEPGNLTSALIFGDGAGAALIEGSRSEDTDGIELVDSLSALVPGSEDALGFALTDNGFLPLLTREIADLLPGPTRLATTNLLERHGLCPANVDFWLVLSSKQARCAGPGPRCEKRATPRQPRFLT
jgi:predicted naringenin-chalcone synthase